MKSENSTEVPGFWTVVKSVLAAMFGVQSSANHERDFQHGRFSHYLVIGLVFTFLFIVSVWGLVKLVMSLALE